MRAPAAGEGGGSDRLGRLAAGVAALRGWRRRGLALVLGALAVAALPPVHVVVALVPAFAGLVWLVDGAERPRSALAVGWWFGFGFFSAGLYWIANAFLVAERLVWISPFAVAGLAAVMACFIAAVTGLTAIVGATGVGRALVLAAAWTASEWARAWAFTGFPWNLLGTVWTFSDAMVQGAALVGTYGLGLVTAAAAAMPAALATAGPGRRRAGWACLAAVAVLAAAWGGGAARLAGADDSTVPGVRLRLVQPNIPQTLKWATDLRDQHLERQLRWSKLPGDPPPTHVIWGETMVPFFIANDPPRLARIGAAVPKGGLMIVGAPRTTPEREPVFRLWNSLQAIDDRGLVVAGYDKFHLVPFGEYVPFRGWLPIEKLTAGATDFSPGPGLVTLRLPGLPPVGPLICYEVIFPGQVARRDDRPGWLLNLTNDAWYGLSAGPYQHFATARLRAVEEGLPLVRVANTGISAVVDAWGRVRARIPLGEAGVADAGLPRALAPPPYAVLGDWSTWLLILVLVGGGVLMSRPLPTRARNDLSGSRVKGHTQDSEHTIV